MKTQKKVPNTGYDEYAFMFRHHDGWEILLKEEGSHIFLSLLEGRQVIEHFTVPKDVMSRSNAYFRFLEDCVEWYLNKT